MENNIEKEAQTNKKKIKERDSNKSRKKNLVKVFSFNH